MTKDDVQKMLEGMRGALQKDEAAGKLASLYVKELEEALSHPKAAEVVAESIGLEATSVQQGDPAPDFTLPWLTEPGSPAHPGTDSVTLSGHFGRRPVALIFGSYT